MTFPEWLSGAERFVRSVLRAHVPIYLKEGGFHHSIIKTLFFTVIFIFIMIYVGTVIEARLFVSNRNARLKMYKMLLFL